MKRHVYKYRFAENVPLQEAEETLFLAALATECLHGRSQMRLDAKFSLDTRKRSCVVDASTQVGCHIARIFTGLLAREFGEEAFKVERVCPGKGSDQTEREMAVAS